MNLVELFTNTNVLTVVLHVRFACLYFIICSLYTNVL